jgi:hypothetical protein
MPTLKQTMLNPVNHGIGYKALPMSVQMQIKEWISLYRHGLIQQQPGIFSGPGIPDALARYRGPSMLEFFVAAKQP